MAARPTMRCCARLIRNATPTRSIRTLSTSAALGQETGTRSTPTGNRPTHFGYETVTETEKQERVAGVFTSVAESYDKMNDFMSFGVHRLWKWVAPVDLYATIRLTQFTNLVFPTEIISCRR